MPESHPEFRSVEVGGGQTLRCAIQGDGPLVVMVHGFPESWYSWRHQIGPIAEAGFTACAIDVRGYGGSDKPHPVEAYAMEHMIADVAGLIEALSPEAPAVIVGHDWGAPIVWNTALTRPDRVRAVAGLSVPYMGVATRSFREVFEENFTARGRFFYQHYFQAVGVAEAELEADVRGSVRRFYYAISGEAPDGTWPNDKPVGAALLDRLPDPDPFPAWLTPADLDYFVGEFEGSGFRGPLNRYRNHDADFIYLQEYAGRRITQPALFIGGQRDLVLAMMGRRDFVAVMKDQIPDLRGADVLPGCGHWTQQERPAEVNARLLAWLGGL
jgi:pimeloyl-ACP methyl ester carboxylesterase